MNLRLSVSFSALALAASCAGPQTQVSTVISQAEQQAMTPQQVVAMLQQGNERFVAGDTTARDYGAQVEASASGQYPMAAILSCVDSRVPVEEVFDIGIGDAFVARVAGNFENVDILGSMEFACKVSGSKVILVLGHSSCGAVKGAVDAVELGNITPMLANIEPAVAKVAARGGERTSKNKDFVAASVHENVLQTVADIRAQSPILKEMEDNGEIAIVGAIYDLETGKVEFLD